MHLECHAALGWLIANAGGGDRRLRNYTVIGAVLPDIDAAPYVLGPYYYGLYHHTFGHNVFLWLLWALGGALAFRSWKAGLLGLVAFGSHLLTDAYLSNWLLYLFWPFSRKGYLPASSQELSSPLNTYLVYATPLVIIASAFIWRRTPLEWISPKLDQLFLSFFGPKKAKCHHCGGGANLVCEACHRPACPRHVQLAARWVIRCSDCANSRKIKPGGPEI